MARHNPFLDRGASPSRMEAFSDAVFAFAVTLLVVSLDVPRTFSELRALMAGFLGFALSFAMIVMIWRTHTHFFRRFALDDVLTLWLNSVLLFLVLFFVYPLKFLFTLVSSMVIGPSVFGGVHPIAPGDEPALMLLYGGGFFAVFAVFALMYVHALRQADVLGLSREERAEARSEVEALALIASFGLVSAAVAHLPGTVGQWAGFVYFLIGPALTVHGFTVARTRMERATAPESVTPEAVTAEDRLGEPLPDDSPGG